MKVLWKWKDKAQEQVGGVADGRMLEHSCALENGRPVKGWIWWKDERVHGWIAELVNRVGSYLPV